MSWPRSQVAKGDALQKRYTRVQISPWPLKFKFCPGDVTGSHH